MKETKIESSAFSLITSLLRQKGQEKKSAAPTIDDVKNCVVVKAKQEILLECGQSSLRLCADGTIILKGVKILSRASKTNKVRGAVVKIN